jgi:hypothetical protein
MSGVGPGAQGQVSAGTTLLWNGANAPVIRLLGTQRSTIEDFFITCPPQTPCSAGVSSETVAAGNPTVNLFHNITMDGVNGTGLGKGFQFIIGAGGCDCNNDANVFDHVGVLNFATAAWSFEHSQSKTHEFRSSYFNGCCTIGSPVSQYGVTTALGGGSGSFKWTGGSGGGVQVDFYLGNPNDYISISNWNSEGSGRFLVASAIGASSNSWAATLMANRWASNGINADGKAIIYNQSGPLILIGNYLCDGNNNTPCQIDLEQTVVGRSVAIANTVQSTLANPFTSQNSRGAWYQFANSNPLTNTGSGANMMPPSMGGTNITTAALGTTGCGAGSPTIVGTSNSFRVTCGSTAAQSFTITWPTARQAIPVVQVTPETPGLGAMNIQSNAVGALTVQWQNAVAGATFSVTAFGD